MTEQSYVEGIIWSFLEIITETVKIYTDRKKEIKKEKEKSSCALRWHESFAPETRQQVFKER